jgi:acyl-CoA thioesterase
VTADPPPGASREPAAGGADAPVGPAWLGIQGGSNGRYGFRLDPTLARYDGQLFGGTGLSLCLALFEATTGRDVLWTTVQFAGPAGVGETIECRVEVLAEGRHTSQLRLTGVVGERLVLVALGATSAASSGGFAARFGTMPEVSAPEDSPPFGLAFSPSSTERKGGGPFAVAEYRQAQAGPGSAVWARMRDARQSRVTFGYLADFVPTAVLGAAGKTGGGTSLDNSIRFGPAPAEGTDWVLVDYDPYFASSGYVHGAARLWSVDGTLLAVASQTAVARMFD